jgi:ABC-type phosphate/phosphonate transport system substrate-binding protein
MSNTSPAAAVAPIVNARMYGVTPAVRALWDAFLDALLAESGIDARRFPHAAPAPIAELWDRRDKAAVLMCGLPFARGQHPGVALAAPVPVPARYADRPVYCSDFVVRADAPYRTLADTFGGRLALTVRDSQSGCIAALARIAALPHDGPRYREIVGPCITPTGIVEAVASGRADVGPVDGYAFDLMRRHAPELVAGVRVLESTPMTPNPLFVADHPHPRIADALLVAHRTPRLAAAMRPLLLKRFEIVEPADYAPLARTAESTLAFWARSPLAAVTPAAFDFSTP